MSHLTRRTLLLAIALCVCALIGGPLLGQQTPAEPAADTPAAQPEDTADTGSETAEEDAAGQNMLSFSWPAFIFSIVNFLLLVGLLYWLLHKPLLQAIDRRRDDIANARKQAEEATDKAEQKKQDYAEKLADIQQERDTLLSEARRLAEEDREKIIDKARKEAERERENLRTDGQRQQRDALENLQEDIVAVALFLARHIVRKLTDETIEDKLRDHLDRELDVLAERADDNMRAELFQSEAPVRVISARALSDERRQALEERIRAIADQEVRIEFDDKADMIAGTRIEFSSAAIDASLADVFQLVHDRLAQVAPGPEEADAETPPDMNAAGGGDKAEKSESKGEGD